MTWQSYVKEVKMCKIFKLNLCLLQYILVYHSCADFNLTECIFAIIMVKKEQIVLWEQFFGNYWEETCSRYEMFLHFLVQVSIIFMSLHPGVLFRIIK